MGEVWPVLIGGEVSDKEDRRREETFCHILGSREVHNVGRDVCRKNPMVSGDQLLHPDL